MATSADKGHDSITEAMLIPFDADFWLTDVNVHASTDQLVERVNNDLQLMWRAGTNAGIPTSTPLMHKLDQWMALWVDFKKQYDDAVFRRAGDPFDWFGRDYDAELRTTWVPKVRQLVIEMAEYSDKAAAALDDVALPARVEETAGKIPPPEDKSGASWGLALGIVVTVGLIGAGAYLARKHV